MSPWKIAPLLLLLAGTGCVGTAVHDSRGLDIDARCVRQFADIDLTHPARSRWQSAVRSANMTIAQSLAGRMLSHTRVRLAFRDGGWVEFRPDLNAVARNRLPPLYAIQFGTAPAAPAASCEAA